MIRADYLLIVEDVKIDDRGRATLVNIAERMSVPSVPAAVTGAKIAFRIHPLNKAIIDKSLDFKIAAELNGSEVWKYEASMKVTIEENNGYAQIIPIEQMVFPNYGVYHIKLFIGDKELASTIFSVRDSSELVER